MREIHDASTDATVSYALFGFVGVPPSARRQHNLTMRDAAVAQLRRLFGNKAAAPQAVLVKDWAEDGFTATESDANGSPPLHD